MTTRNEPTVRRDLVDDRMFWDNVYTNLSAQGDAR